MSPEPHEYLETHSGGPDPVFAHVAEKTRTLAATSERHTPGPMPPQGGRLLTLLTRASGARDAIEVGTFTGTSSVGIARGLPADGRLLCLDVDAEWTAIAQDAWERAGVADRIELRLGPALPALRALPTGPSLDLAFIDADKEGYRDYLDELVPRLRPGGLLLADNALWHGRVYDPENHDPITEAIRRYNDAVRDDDRLDSMILPLWDGLTLAVRR